ncbi:MAG TPA: tRNA (adenosine(37)-N6)-dimethylallyltransferase MiaA, partial [Candidatus Limnocylindria bacterium]|nr:tRNA (adenosine(37)-N6)-dimethylallyltransferase MiaA [Candidatus Limnocylindria bacterium]
PDTAALRAVPHHLLDLVEPDQPFTLADWLSHARAVVSEVWARGRLPLVVGGTGLYVSALIDGYELGAAAPSGELRRALTAELEAEGLRPLAARLTELDPDGAARTDLRNPRRVLRALERAITGGAPAAAATTHPWTGPVALIGLHRPTAVLDARIRARAAWMFAHGLLDEVGELRNRGLGENLAPMTGHGYREAFMVLSGELTPERAMEVTALHTRQYAKRQMTWFRRDQRIEWLEVGEGSAADLAGAVVEQLRPLMPGS